MAQTARIHDEDIKNDVAAHITQDARIDSRSIIVEVKDGKVTLSGFVSLYFDSQQAQRIALHTKGVTSVENRLRIKFPGILTEPSDQEVSDRVKSVLVWDPHIDASRIHVEAAGGRVTLTGTVNTYKEKMKAEEITSNITGVFGLENDLKVMPRESPIDDDICRDIVTRLKKNTPLDLRFLHITVDRGTATITGEVLDFYYYRYLEDTVSNTKGVVAVDNQVYIRRPFDALASDQLVMSRKESTGETG
jgi:osmotically-inducible protein OsmY